MAKILKILSTAALFYALSWTGEVSARNLSRVPGDILNMDISVSCKDGNATFTIINNGKAWPAVANLSVYSTEITKRIHRRRMRFAEGQRATFQVLGTPGEGSEIGLWVDPSWFKRAFNYDAKIRCR